MKQKFVYRVWATLIGVTVAGTAFGQTAPLRQKSPDAGEIARIAQERGFVRVIVQFDRPASAAQVRADATGIGALRSAVAAQQDAIISTHFGSVSTPSSGPGFDR